MKKLLSIAIMFTMLMSFTSCMKKYQEKVYVTVQPNETAFLIPLEGKSKANQGKFDSEAYLNDKKVAAKRIEIPTRWHQEGRIEKDGKWIPTHMVIKVNRTPMTREWTDGGSGSSKSNQAMGVESSGSIAFQIGATASATILSDDAALFLFFYNGKSLSDVMDKNVRPYIQDQLAKSYSMHDLATARKMKKKIFAAAEINTIKFFKEKGVTIEYVGVAGGMTYKDKAIQTSINENFTSAMKLQTATNAVLAAKKFATAAKAIEANQMLEAKIKWIDACCVAMEKGLFPVPNTWTGDRSPVNMVKMMPK